MSSGGNETTPRPGAAPEPPTHPDASKESSVVIVGAGMSGLCAARALTNAGFTKVTIVEARDHIGGRTVTKEIGDSGVMVDAGAAWIHGTKDNPLVAMCEDYGIPYVEHREMKESSAAIVDLSDDFEERRAWTAEEVAKAGALAYEAIPTLKPGVSALESFQTFVDGKDDLSDGEKDRVKFTLEAIISGAAGPMSDVNVFYPMTQETGRLSPGYDQLIVGGYNSLTAKLADGLNIEFNRVVEKIEDMGNKKVMIACKDGSEYFADFVICSLPLGVLKSTNVEFKPALPERLSSAIGKISMGGFEKVILVWDDHFYKGWVENLDEFKDNKIIINANRSCPGKSPFSLWIDISGKTDKPTVVCLYSGAFAKEVQGDETKTDQDIVAEAIKHFAAGLGKSVDEIPTPVATMCTRWHSDPFALGSYSYIPVAAKVEDFDALAEPIYDGRLMFCGEHTIKEHNASVHGPVLSGLREARRLDKEAHLKKVIPGIIPK